MANSTQLSRQPSIQHSALLSASNISISIEFIRTALVHVQLSEDELEALFHASRIPKALLNQSNARVSLTQFAHFVTMLMNQTNDELLGYGQTPHRIGSLSLLMHWLIAADNIEHAVKRLEHFYQIMAPGLDISLRLYEDGSNNNNDPRFGLHITKAVDTKGAFQTYLYEFGFFFIHRILGWLTKDVVRIKRLDFPFSQTSYAKDYRVMFYGAPINFDSNNPRIEFSTDILDRPIKQDLAGLKQLLRSPFSQLLILNFQDDRWSARVTRLLQSDVQAHLASLNETDSQTFSLADLKNIAERLGVADYSLQRKLAKEGNSFLTIKNQVKRDTAIELLVHSQRSIEQISQCLGFSETSPFTRTFKQWTGVPPSAYRKQLPSSDTDTHLH